MDRQGSKIGKCHVCGRTELLSLEHIPPQSAFNNSRAFVYSGESILRNKSFPWNVSGIKGRQHQSGIGFNTLCRQCNSDTGAWYGPDFARFANSGMNQFEIHASKKAKITIQNFYPLRVIKEVVCMFLSINSPELAEKELELRNFVLDKNKSGLSKKFSLGMYFFIGSMSKYLGITAKLNTLTGEIQLLSELTFPPFGYVLEIDPKKNSRYSDLNFFANYKYTEIVKNMTIDIPVLESNTYFPGDHRTKDEVKETRRRNEELKEFAAKGKIN